MCKVLIMELRQLRYFVAVAEELHFGRAAERCHISQPPLSQQIKALEEEVGATLLMRTSRRVELTREGAVFLERARDILSRVGEAAEHVGAMARGEVGRLKVRFVGPASQTDFPLALRSFREENPNIGLELREMPTYGQLEVVRAGEIDVGIIRSYYHDLTGLDWRVFSHEPYVLALPGDHPLARRESVELAMCDGIPYVDFPRHYQPRLHDDIEAAFLQAGVQPKPVQEASTKLSTIALVAAGMGAALVPRSMRRLKHDGVVYRPFEPEYALPPVQLRLIWRKGDASPLLARFLDVFARFCPELHRKKGAAA